MKRDKPALPSQDWSVDAAEVMSLQSLHNLPRCPGSLGDLPLLHFPSLAVLVVTAIGQFGAKSFGKLLPWPPPSII